MVLMSYETTCKPAAARIHVAVCVCCRARFELLRPWVLPGRSEQVMPTAYLLTAVRGSITHVSTCGEHSCASTLHVRWEVQEFEGIISCTAVTRRSYWAWLGSLQGVLSCSFT